MAGDENSAYRLARELEIAGNQTEALKWWRKAADLGNTIAMERVGLAYLNGTVVEKDLAKSLTYLKRASADGRVIPARVSAPLRPVARLRGGEAGRREESGEEENVSTGS